MRYPQKSHAAFDPTTHCDQPCGSLLLGAVCQSASCILALARARSLPALSRLPLAIARARSAPALFRLPLALSLATTMATAASVVIQVGPLGFPYTPIDPFLFAVYHRDDYPAGDEKMRAPRRGDGAVRVGAFTFHN